MRLWLEDTLGGIGRPANEINPIYSLDFNSRWDGGGRLVPFSFHAAELGPCEPAAGGS